MARRCRLAWFQILLSLGKFLLASAWKRRCGSPGGADTAAWWQLLAVRARRGPSVGVGAPSLHNPGAGGESTGCAGLRSDCCFCFALLGAVQVQAFPAHPWQRRQSFPCGTVRSPSCLWRGACCLSFSSSSAISLRCSSTTSTSTRPCGGTRPPTLLRTRRW